MTVQQGAAKTASSSAKTLRVSLRALQQYATLAVSGAGYRRRQLSTLLGASVLLLLVCGFYAEVLFMGRMYGPAINIAWVTGMTGPWGFNGQGARVNPYRVDEGESTWSLYPDTREVATAYSEARLPLWNSHVGFGAPLAASTMPGAFDLLRLPPLVSSKPVAWDIYYIAGSTLGVLLSYLFARKIGMGLQASVLLPVVYVFSGFLFIRGNNYYMELFYLLPGLLWGTEIVVQGKLRAGMIVVVTMVTLSVLAGFPEGALLTFSYAAAYGVYRLAGLWLDKAPLRIVCARGGLLGLAGLIGLAISAPSTIPLMEFIAYAYNRHTADNQFGLLQLPVAALAFYGLPYFRAQQLQVGFEDYTGAALLALACVGVATLIWPHGQRRPVLFAVGATLVVGGKLFGLPVVNDLGRLPLFNVVFISVFANPLLVFSLALLAAHAVQLTAEAKLPGRCFTYGLLLFVGYIAAAFGLNWETIRAMDVPKVMVDFAWATALGCLTIGIAAVLIRSRPGIAALGACGAVVAELFLLMPHGVYDDRVDILAKPPFVSFLQQQQQVQGPFRIFSTQRVLYPDLSEAFGLDDIRGLEALFPLRYWVFVTEFIQPLFDRFTGVAEQTGQPPVLLSSNKWLNLTNVKYLLFQPGSAPETSEQDLLTKLSSEYEGPIAPAPGMLQIDGIMRTTLFQHPPSTITHSLQLDDAHSLLKFWLALDPRVWDPSKGDGVLFAIDVVDAEGTYNVFQRTIDPKNNPDDRHWIDGQADLSAFVGRSVLLKLTTGFLENNLNDWAGWGDLHFESAPGRSAGQAQFMRAYAGEVDVYENRAVQPRAFLVNSVLAAADMDAALRTMKAPDFDPTRTAVVEAAPSADLEQVKLSGQAVGTAQVERYTEQDAVIAVSTEVPALLVLTDTFFPGWEATIDGRSVAVYPADVAFRGVLVPSGTHLITFSYQPASFTFALIVAAVGCGLLLVALYILRPHCHL